MDKCSFNARWVDEQHKQKSRYVVKDFANTRDPTMFAAASDTAMGRVVDFKTVLQNYSMFTFDVTPAYMHAWEDELVFLEPPLEENEEHGDCVWRSIRVIYGRRKGARSWQEHFDSILKSEQARQRGFTVESHPKCPTLYHVREADGAVELHVDDGHGDGHWASNCQIGSDASLEGKLCSPWSNFRSRHRVKKVRFSVEKQYFSLE